MANPRKSNTALASGRSDAGSTSAPLAALELAEIAPQPPGRLTSNWVIRHDISPDGTAVFEDTTTKTSTTSDPRPASINLPSGWEVHAVEGEDGSWYFTHISSGLESRQHPGGLTRKTLEAIEAVSAYGPLPTGWSVRLGDRAQLEYDRRGSNTVSLRHPHDDAAVRIMHALSSCGYSPRGGSRAVFHPVGHSHVVTDQNKIWAELGILEEGTIILENLDLWRIMQVYGQTGVPVALLAKHLFARNRPIGWNGPETEQLMELCRNYLQQWAGHCQTKWPHTQWDAYYDDSTESLQWLDPVELASIELSSRDADITRVSIFKLRPKLALVVCDSLAGGRDLDKRVYERLGDYVTGLLPACFSDTLTAQLALPNPFNAISHFCQSRINLGLLKALDSTYDRSLQWALAYSTCQANFDFLNAEFEYLDIEAVEAPKLEDFGRLTRNRKRIRTEPKQLRVCIERLDFLTSSMNHRDTVQWQSTFSENPDVMLSDMEKWAKDHEDLKQNFDDTLQLLIGAINVLDASVQKRVAEDNRIQARRSTALTALAAVYLPLSLATSILGMNVKEINDSKPSWKAAVALGVGFLALSIPVLVLIFMDKGRNGSEEKRFDLPTGWKRMYRRMGLLQ